MQYKIWSTVHAVFISNTFISNVALKLAKNQANAKQHPEAELLLMEIIPILHSRYHPKILGHTLKTRTKCLNHNENEKEKEK